MRTTTRISALSLLLSLTVLAAPVRADLLTPGNFQLFAVHPDAQTQGTTQGMTISNITPFNGNLFFGYGDYASDTGPITIRSLNPTTATWSNSLLSFGTEAVSHYRQIGIDLYTPNVDPRGLPGVNPGGFAIGTNGGTTWSQMDRVAATHVFDIVTYNGSDLWMVGSVGIQGAVWRSTDGGITFTPVRLDDPAPGSPPVVFSRYMGIGVLNNNVYVQRTDFNGAPVDSSLVFNGSTWSPGPDLITQTNGFMWRASAFQGQLVYMDGDRNLGSLYKFDGSLASLAYTSQLRDYFLTSDRFYGLTTTGELIESADLSSWTVLGAAPATATSLAVVGSDIFVGTNQATILKAALTEPTAVPEPSSLALAGCAALLAMGRKLYRSRRQRRSADRP